MENILPTIAGVSGLFAGGAVFYSKLRPLFPVKVNCWFCNQDSKVHFYEKNNFVCKNCEQYNGFNKNGDYNQDIPSMYCEGLNSPSNVVRHQQSHKKPSSPSNGLCQTCNLNQTLKLRALADYTPIHESNYDQEIEEYRKRLDSTYSLCRSCEASLHQTLGQQNSWLKPKLISWRLQQSQNNKMNIQNKQELKRRPKCHPLVLIHLMEMMCPILLCLVNIYSFALKSGFSLPKGDMGVVLEEYASYSEQFISIVSTAGLACMIIRLLSSGMDSFMISDGLSSFTWVGLIMLISSQYHLTPIQDLSAKICVSLVLLLTTAISFINAEQNKPKTIKKRDSLNLSKRSNTSLGDLNDTTMSPLNRSLNSSCGHSPPMMVNDITPPSYSNRVNVNLPSHTDITITSQRVDLDDTLSEMKIGTPQKPSLNSSVNFTPRSLFSERTQSVGTASVRNKSILSPSRLSTKHVNQSSWVAGGYWGSPGSPQRNNLRNNLIYDKAPLSRSSSQSSGFISHCSGVPPSFAHQGPFSVPNSRQGSICDEERNSVLSEPAYFNWQSHNESARQLNSISRAASQSDLQSLYNAPSVISDVNSLRSSPQMNSTFMLPNTSLENAGQTSDQLQLMSLLNYKNPWVAFILGVSVAANVFFIFMLGTGLKLGFVTS